MTGYVPPHMELPVTWTDVSGATVSILININMHKLMFDHSTITSMYFLILAIMHSYHGDNLRLNVVHL